MVLLNKPEVPHKGWSLHDSIDLCIDEGLEYGDYENCGYCGQEQIRFVHVLSHPEYGDHIRTGSVCAEKLTEDYVNPRAKERKLRNRAARRARFSRRSWRVSTNGNHYLDYDGYFVLAYQTPEGKFKAKIDGKFGKLEYTTLVDAKLGIFDAIEKMKKLKRQ